MERGAGGRERVAETEGGQGAGGGGGGQAERVKVKVHEIGSGEKGREVREG